MEKAIYKVRKRAKKYRNWFEKISVNPFPWLIHDKNYFLITYTKSSHIQGVAILSDSKENPQHAKQAHQPLFLFYRLMNHIHMTGYMRSNIDLTYFKDPLKLSSEREITASQEGHDLVQTLLDKQSQFKGIYDHFFTHLSSLNKQQQPISQTELELAIETSSMLEILHYEIMSEMFEGFDALKIWFDTMKDEGLWEKLNQNQRVFFQQMIQNESNMEEELNNVPVVKHKNRDKMLKLTKEKYAKFKEDKRKEESKTLRYP
ncbi:hypothetical protein [Salipaludibacillus daqingensis]|uniref:hypothetical protein n=1 Tax=Salipaludibacillus daqingensis TaxID=3041001 RepID=UPI002473584A|nr:hypothetical protein [Salipaludibacillus daqingensis]